MVFAHRKSISSYYRLTEYVSHCLFVRVFVCVHTLTFLGHVSVAFSLENQTPDTACLRPAAREVCVFQLRL